MNIATPTAARKPYFALPREIFEDPYFAIDADRPYSRIEALADLSARSRWTDNCVTRKGQVAVSMPELAKAWRWTLKQVRGFLEALKRRAQLGLKRAHIEGAWKSLITLMFSPHYAGEDQPKGRMDGRMDGRKQGASIDSNKEKGNQDSRQSQAPDPSVHQTYDGGFPGDEERAGADTSEIPPEPSEVIADIVPPNSAAPPKVYPEAFDNLWAKVPHAAKRGGKKKPFEVWRRAGVAVRTQIELGVVLWARRCEGADPKYIPMAQTWFNQARWETEIDDGQSTGADQFNDDMEAVFA